MGIGKMEISVIMPVYKSEQYVEEAIRSIIKQTIGKGTFGKVKLGIYLPTKEKVAIKILEKSKMVEEDDIERAYREMKIIQDLKHQNIVQIFEILGKSSFLNSFIIIIFI